MNISVFGLGYVGSVSAASLAADGHQVIGVDVSPDKVAQVNAGRSPIVEPGLDELLARTVAAGRLRATTDAAQAVRDSEVSLLCVGTPSRRNGSLDLVAPDERVRADWGGAAATSPAITSSSSAAPCCRARRTASSFRRSSAHRARSTATGSALSVNPEFLREGTALKDFREPPLTLVGHNHAADATGTIALYRAIDAPLVSTSIGVAEMVKYTSNTWHALKVCFANEIGNVCKRLGVDSHEVMDIFCRDRKLNLSPYYLKPGFAFGGSCLPKDVRALQYRAKELDVDLPVIQSILPSNRLQIQHALDEIIDAGSKKVGLLGFSFKDGHRRPAREPDGDPRRSAARQGLSDLASTTGTSRWRGWSAPTRRISSSRFRTCRRCSATRSTRCIERSEVIVVGNRSPEFADAIAACRADQIVIDLVRLPIDGALVAADYRGICW